ncbi:MAG: hypothetical protein AB7U46_13985 [Paenirhodobacter sp.]|uniref:hypothetical protein n=1 Tax=Paenirhodobacter sp. TaxID=1965326 RepID=UPI003D119720
MTDRSFPVLARRAPLRLALACALAFCATVQGAAADPAKIATLLHSEKLFSILQQEGVHYGDDLADELLPGGADPGWRAEVAAIHAPARLLPPYEEVLGAALAAEKADQGAIERWLGSDLGQRVVTQEIAARAAMLDQSVEDAAIARAEEADAAQDPKLDAVREIIEAADLVEPNVAGGLNANLAFYRAMAQGGAFPYEVTESDMLADVAAQEDDIRADVTSWMEGYLFLAYQGLSLEDLHRCAEFNASEAGQALLRAQFQGFDHVYERSSAELGTALARRLNAAEL